jgi:hypothetical protein
VSETISGPGAEFIGARPAVRLGFDYQTTLGSPRAVERVDRSEE